MPNNVRIEFLGLMGVVPNRRGEADEVDSYLIALPDLEYGLQDNRLPIDPEYIDGSEHRHGTLGFAPPHVPALVVPTDSIVSESFKQAEMKFDCRSGAFANSNYSIFLFEGEKLTLAPLKNAALEARNDPVVPDQGATRSPATPERRRGLQWIPKLSLANGHAGRQTGTFDREHYLNPDLTPRSTQDLRLAGTVPVDRGRFYVEDVISDEGIPSVFDFKVPGGAVPEWQQSIYTKMIWETEVVGDRLDLVFSNGSGDQRGTVSLRSLYGRWDIWIANLELEALLGVGGQTQQRSRADLDFAVSYLLSTRVPDARQGMPVPHEVGGGLGGGYPRCNAAMFDG